MKKYSIGIDLGGTKILAAIVDIKTGEVIDEVKNKTKKLRGNNNILEITIQTIKELLEIVNKK